MQNLNCIMSKICQNNVILNLFKTKPFTLILLLTSCFFVFQKSIAQHTFYFQGFETNPSECPENWSYSGGNVNSEIAYEGQNSLRIGRQGESNTAEFQAVDVSELINGVLTVRHAVRPGQGPGMDTREGAVFLISLNGNPFQVISGVSGFGDHNYSWNQVGGASASSAGCQTYSTPNPFTFTIPAGTSTIALRVISVRANNCSNFNNAMENGIAQNYDRSDEGFFIDAVSITGDIPVFPDLSAEYCEDAEIADFPEVSENSISGTWTPTINNQTTSTYFFLPNMGSCPSNSTEIVINPKGSPPPTACYETATFNAATCEWEISGEQPQEPTTACYELATFNAQTCEWEITGTQPTEPTTACYETATFNAATCEWEITGNQPQEPTISCYELATFNAQTCEWEITGSQPAQPTTACYETATFNAATCEWEITGEQPQEPTTACYETTTFNAQTCEWEISGTQPLEPTDLECGETATFNSNTCEWEISGSSTNPVAPEIACYQTAEFNEETCEWNITGIQEPEPQTQCYETATFNEQSCEWEISGTQPTQPTIACYEIATFNAATCEWEVSGDQPQEPTTACYESATFNAQTCEWEITGNQPAQPTTACYETSTFNFQSCEWEVSGQMPEEPNVSCDEVSTFNPVSCEWEITEESEIYEDELEVCETELPFEWSGVLFSESGSQTNTFQTEAGCDSTVIMTLLVTESPNYAVSAIDPSECGELGTLRFSNLNENESYSISYNNQGFNDYISDNNGVINIENLPTGVYDQIIVSLNGCQVEHIASLELLEPESPDLSLANDTVICEGESITLIANATNGSTITWDNNIIDGQSFLPSVGTNTYTATATLNGCSVSEQIIVEALPAPEVDAGSDLSLCAGSEVTLTAANPSGATIQWSNGVIDGVPFIPGIGNNTYTVTASSDLCSSADEVTVFVEEAISFEINQQGELGCIDEDVEFTYTLTSGNVDNCFWEFGNGITSNDCSGQWQSFSNQGCVDVTLTLSNSAGCTTSVTQNNTICIYNYPEANFILDNYEITEENPSIQTTNLSEGGTNYYWEFGDGVGTSTAVSPSYEYTNLNDGNLFVDLFVYNQAGCVDSMRQRIQVVADVIYYVPNAFTPDGNQFNDVFQPVFTSGFDPFEYELQIYNRWGELIFVSKNSDIGWDGTYQNYDAQEGTYIWKINFKEAFTDKRYSINGHVTLIR